LRASESLLDATDTVSIGDVDAVAKATDQILVKCFGAQSFDHELLHATFRLVGRLFAGEHPGYLACDMPYHDLRHSLDTALVMARLIDGYQRGQRDSTSKLPPEYGLLGVLLGLLHDSGYIRATSEAALCGPQLTADHESRSVEFAEDYLQATSLAALAPLASLIITTRLATDLQQLFARYDAPAIALGQMLGSADLLSQVSDRCYLERCYYHLYPELVLGGCDRVRTPNGQEQVLYRNAFDLLSRTLTFYEKVVCKRLRDDFQQMTQHLIAHFSGADPYSASIQRNLDRLARIINDGTSSLLRQAPATTTRDLAAIYRAHPPRGAPLDMPRGSGSS